MYMSVCVCVCERERESLYIPRKVDARAATRRRHTSCGRLRAGLLHTLRMRVCVCVCVCVCVFVRAFNVWCSPHAKTVDGACVRDAWQGICTLQQCVCVHRYVDMHAAHTHTRQNATWKCHTAHTHTHLDCVYVCVCVHIPQSSMDMHTDHTHTHASAVCERVALAT